MFNKDDQSEIFSGRVFTVRRNVFSFFGATLKVLNEKNQQILYCRQKAFKLKEDVRVYQDSTKTREILHIKARNIIDFSATYDVFDSQTGSKVGSIKRKGMKSLFKDEWLVQDENDNQIGVIKEDNRLLAFLRRLLGGFAFPQTFKVFLGDKQVASFHRAFNPFVSKMKVDFSVDEKNLFDHKLGLASALLLILIERRN